MPTSTSLTASGLRRLQQTLDREQRRLDEARDTVRQQLQANEAESLGLVEAQQGLAALEQQVEDLCELLAGAQVLEHPSGAHDVVQFGDTIILTDLASGKVQRVQLVSKAEAAGATGTLVQISPDSPVGSQLEDRQVGETIRIVLKQREVQYRITEIEPYGD